MSRLNGPLRFTASTIRKSAPPIFYFVVLANYITSNHYELHSIHGASMAPFLSPAYHETRQKDKVLFKKNIRFTDEYSDVSWSNAKSELKRGMIVSFISPLSSQLAVKRVIALGGDKVKPLGRHNLSSAAKDQGVIMGDQEEEVTVPFGHVWVEGDQVDREKNIDSNCYGPISKSLINGVATWILWPNDRRRRIEWEKDGEKRTEGRVVRAKDDHYLPKEWSIY